MIEARGVVVRTSAAQAWVKVDDQPGGCGRCHEPGGCGGAKIAYAFGKPDDVYAVPNPDGFHAGDRVLMQIDDGAALGAAAVSYGVPTLGVLVGAGVGTLLAGNLGGLVGVMLALGASIWWVKRIGANRAWHSRLAIRVRQDAGCPSGAERHA